jgi:hypothetical protein
VPPVVTAIVQLYIVPDKLFGPSYYLTFFHL